MRLDKKPLEDLCVWERKFSTPTKGAHRTVSILHQLCDPARYVSNPCSRKPRLHSYNKTVQACSAIQQRTFGKTKVDGGLCWSYALSHCSPSQNRNHPSTKSQWVLFHSATAHTFWIWFPSSAANKILIWIVSICITCSSRFLIWMRKFICSYTSRHLASMRSNSS